MPPQPHPVIDVKAMAKGTRVKRPMGWSEGRRHRGGPCGTGVRGAEGELPMSFQETRESRRA